VNLPAITRLLKPKHGTIRQAYVGSEGQERAKSVDFRAESLVDESERRLKLQLTLLSDRAKGAGLLVNTGTLWRQSRYVYESVSTS